MMPLCLVLERRNRKQQRFDLRSPRTVLGREKGCDIRIPSADVSRRHCLFTVKENKVFLEDLKSVNGTYVNEVAVIGTEEIQPGDRVQMGPVTFVVEFSPVLDNAPTTIEHKGAYVLPEGLEEVDLEEVEIIEEDVEIVEDDEEIPDGEIILDDDVPLLLPESGDLRGILTQLTDSDHPANPKKP
jgi:pSer/pThr/pTyr-binding forkhead associated (FHA) protein